MLLSASVAFAQKIVHVEEAGTLKDKLTEEEMLSLTELTLTGKFKWYGHSLYSCDGRKYHCGRKNRWEIAGT